MTYIGSDHLPHSSITIQPLKKHKDRSPYL